MQRLSRLGNYFRVTTRDSGRMRSILTAPSPPSSTSPRVYHVQRVRTLDTFARSRVIQYLKRLKVVSSSRWVGGPQEMESRLVVHSDSSSLAQSASESADSASLGSLLLFVTTIYIPLIDCPPAGSISFEDWVSTAVEGVDVLTAVGVANDSRANAEVAAAMHAEMLLNATNRCLYVVPSSQKRYALQLRAEGQHAPMPGDPIRVLSSAKEQEQLPLPLCWTSVGDESSTSVFEGKTVVVQLPRRPSATPSSGASNINKTRVSSHRSAEERPNKFSKVGEDSRPQDETEGGKYQLCNMNTSRCGDGLVLCSMALIDVSSQHRVDAWLNARGIGSVERCAQTCTEAAATNIGVSAMFVSRLVLSDYLTEDDKKQCPAATWLNGLVAEGKASTMARSLILCAMHAEVLLFYCRIPLVQPPRDKDYDRLMQGRGFPILTPDAPSSLPPIPLKELHPTKNDVEVRHLRVSPYSNEEKYLRYHGEAFNYSKTFIQINACRWKHDLIPGFGSYDEAEAALERFQKMLKMRSLFFVTAGSSSSYRTTLLLHNLEYGAALAARQLHHPSLAGTVEEPHIIDDTEIVNSRFSRRSQDQDCRRLPVVALGCGPDYDTARALCVMHALDIINALNLALFPDDPSRQAAYEQQRRQLGLYAPKPEDQGRFPTSHHRLLHQHNPNAPIQHWEKREHPNDDFAVTLACAPSPSYAHEEKRETKPPPAEEVARIMQLHSCEHFTVVDDEKVKEINSFYSGVIQAHIRRCCSSSPELALRRALVEDQGSGWRHRSTAWLNLPILVSSDDVHRSMTVRWVTAVGRGIRLQEAERALNCHAALLLHVNGALVVDNSRRNEHIAILRSIGYHVDAKEQRQRLPAVPIKAMNGGGGVHTTNSCPPVITQSCFEGLMSHRKLYDRLRSEASDRANVFLAHLTCEVLP